jgi:hypothetical protein
MTVIDLKYRMFNSPVRLLSAAAACVVLLSFSGSAAPALAQVAAQAPAAGQQSSLFESVMRPASATVLMAGNRAVHLWGVEDVSSTDPVFPLRARTALANVISGGKVQCEAKGRRDEQILAQCVNRSDLDLSLFMIQQGYVTVDRAAVYGSVFEDVYVQAEMEAQDRGLGVWAVSKGEGGSLASAEGSLMISFGFVLFLCIIGAFTFLSIIIMRGFKQVIDAQTENMNLVSRERRLRDKERTIVAVMLDSELKANKSKIEAYLVVYEETLSALKDPERPPKYKKAGDIVQMQPALDRSVFDRNTDKLDILGRQLASDLIHFYARIKSNADYENIEPDMPLDEVVKLVDNAVRNGQRLNKLADNLIKAFEGSGVMNETSQDAGL